MYDIIGDIHGHAAKLRQLLRQLGYHGLDRTPHCPGRTAVFVGDLIDRGPEIGAVLRLVRAMTDAGHAVAVMGNHEFNAIAYHTEDPQQPGRFLRPHEKEKVAQHAETMRQLSPVELAQALQWFRTLPLWLELDGIRVIHACWAPQQMQVVQGALSQHGGVTTPFMVQATRRHSDLFKAVEVLLKGHELRLPGGEAFLDKDGQPREKIRVKWYAPPRPQTYASYALSAESLQQSLPQRAVPRGSLLPGYPPEAPPVFFGHYWLRPRLNPFPLAHNVACLDYSVAKGGVLAAYRWDGEPQLERDKLVCVG